jgi:signal transduction histidine kinase
MTLFSSLRSRIALTSALLALLAIAVAIYVVNVRVTHETEKALQREIVTTGALVEQLRTTETETFRTLARLIADAPTLKAAVSTDDPRTVREELGKILDQYRSSLTSTLMIVTNKSGGILATVGASEQNARGIAREPAVHAALAGREDFSLLPQPAGILQVVTVPIQIVTALIPLEQPNPEILGTLLVGFPLDDALAAQLKENSGSDIAFGMDGRVLASTLTREDRGALEELLRRPDLLGSGNSVHIGSEYYMALSRPLAARSRGGVLPSGSQPVVLILRSRADQRQLLQSIHAGLAVTAIVAVLLATLLSFAVARTITRPLAAITDVMHEVTATGDLTRKIALGSGHRWDDEDARLLATTFNRLTDSIARFQREISQKERLSSLGRLSTVIAHEVRNPLMIIKASLHPLRQPDVGAAAMREAIADIDEEVARLNRIVNEVLDFARPIAFERAPADLNALCHESAAASVAASPGPAVHLDLDQTLPPVVVDPERLRIALVNMLVNARQAVEARDRALEPVAAAGTATGATAGAQPSAAETSAITLQTMVRGDRATIVITDRGGGIEPADLPRIFDPYFTTKRGGTGLGLPIAKNIIEGLGGTILVTSMPGQGTEIRLDLPIGGAAGPLPQVKS